MFIFLDSKYLLSVLTPDNQDEKDDQVDKAKSPPTIQQALDAAKLVGNFLLFNQDDSTTYLDMNRIHKIIQNKYWHITKSQTKLSDYMCKQLSKTYIQLKILVNLFIFLFTLYNDNSLS